MGSNHSQGLKISKRNAIWTRRSYQIFINRLQILQHVIQVFCTYLLKTSTEFVLCRCANFQLSVKVLVTILFKKVNEAAGWTPYERNEKFEISQLISVDLINFTSFPVSAMNFEMQSF